MSTLYEIVELANGDIALQKEGDAKNNSNRAPLVTMRFSTDLLRFLRNAKMDIAKVMIEAGLERVANLAESVSREELESKIDKHTTFEFDRRTQRPTVDGSVADSPANKPVGREQTINTFNAQGRSKQTPNNQSASGQSLHRLRAAKSLGSGHDINADQEDQHPTISHLLH